MMDLLMNIPAGLWALIGTLVGTVGLKVSEAWLNRSRAARESRADDRAESKELRDKIDKLEDEVTLWRGKTYESDEDNSRLRRQIIEGGGLPSERQKPNA